YLRDFRMSLHLLVIPFCTDALCTRLRLKCELIRQWERHQSGSCFTVVSGIETIQAGLRNSEGLEF
ncbi:MAG TPA: hypothetical protein QF611_05935, partial [Pseudomonadales bacterium]|nr:hypothetical protein [Pseudomonadales bacterium]